MAAVIEQEVVGAEVERRNQISWGAVFAGLAFVVALSWLMFLLGSAIGVGIADATDMAAMGDGLGVGAIVWMLLTSIIAFFLGSVLAGRLANKADRTAGILHGVTLWSVGTALMIVLGYAGVSSLIQTGQNLVKSTAAASAAVGSTALAGLDAAGTGLTDSPLVTSIQAQIKRKAGEIVAQAGGAEVTQQEATQAINQIDDNTLASMAGQIVSGDAEGAKKALADNTSLSRQEINSIIDGISAEVQQAVPNQLNSAAFLTNVQNQLKEKASGIIAQMDAPGGTVVSQQEIERAIEQLDGNTLQRVAWQLVQGNVDNAKNTLVVNTTLEEKDINAIVDGVNEEVQKQVSELKAEINQGIETASDYTQAVLWIAFISALIGLIAAIFGGRFGADAVNRVYAVGARRKIEV